MAARLLLPGYGGKYTSEAIAFGGTGADIIDCSRTFQLLFEVVQHSGDAATVTVQTSLDPTFPGTPATLTTFSSALGTIKPIPGTAAVAPFGFIRFVMSAGTSGTTQIAVTGWEAQRES